MRGQKKKSQSHFSFPLTVAAPDLLDPKSATHNSKPRLSFSTKPITMSPRQESEVREINRNPDMRGNLGRGLLCVYVG